MISAQTLSERLQKGLFEEEANHNLPAAIEEYKAVIADADQQRRLTATAIFRLAESYRKLGRHEEARPLYERLLRDFSDQTQLVESASARLPQRETGPGDQAHQQEHDFAALERLLDNSPDLLNSPATNQMTFLQHAAIKGDIEMIKFLVKRGAKLEQTTQQRNDPALMMAVRQGHKRAAEELLKAGANVDGLASIGRDTPLETAASLGYLEVAKLLIESGADVNLGFRGWTPLHAAAMNGHVDIIKLLVKAGANLEAVDYKGETPLIAAILGYHQTSQQRVPQPQAVAALLEAGADPNNKGNKEAPLVLALKSPNWLIFDALMRSEKTDVNATGTFDVTPVMQAVVSERWDALEKLIKRNADLNKQSRDGTTALHLAVQRGDHSSAKLLLQHGANPNIQNDDGRSPLHFAAGFSFSGTSKPVDAEMVDLLLQHKADPNLPDNQGVTPVRQAVARGAVEAVERLLAAKGNPNSIANDGYAPLDLNEARHTPKLREILEQAGATNSLKFSTNNQSRIPAAGAFLPAPQSYGVPGAASEPSRQAPRRRIRESVPPPP